MSDVLLLGAFCAAFVACFCAGFIVKGWVEQERVRTVPEHPSLKNIRDVEQHPLQHHLRVIEGGYELYDWKREGGA